MFLSQTIGLAPQVTNVEKKLFEGRESLKKAGIIIRGRWEQALIDFEMVQNERIIGNKVTKNEGKIEQNKVDIYTRDEGIEGPRNSEQTSSDNLAKIADKIRNQRVPTSGGLADKIDGY